MAGGAGVAHPFIGRTEAIEALYRRSDDARAGHGGVTLLIGEPGVGKTTLVEEVVRGLQERGIQVLVARAPSFENPPPFFLVREALSSLQGPDPSDRSTGRDAPPLGSVPGAPEAILIGFAPRIGLEEPEGPVAIEARLFDALSQAGERADVHRERLYSALTDQFLALARRGPTVLVLDDFHLADDSSLEALEQIAFALENQPLWILATLIPPSTLPEARRARIERFEGTTGANRVTVRPFTTTEVSEYVRIVEPERETSSEQIARWHSETGGNPLFLSQILRSQRERGAQAATPSGPTSRLELGEFIARILPTLDENEQRVMTMASALGREFSFQLLLRASHEDEEPLAEVTDRLVGKGLFVERPQETLAFIADELRNRVYASLTESRRRVLHRHAGEAIETTGTVDVQSVFALARHFYLGKVADKAEAYNHIAADIAIRSYAATDAREHLERALESHRRAFPKDTPGEVELVLELAVQLDRLGELDRAEALLKEILARHEVKKTATPSQLAMLRLTLTRVLTDRGEWQRAEEETRELLADLDPSISTMAQIAIQRLRGESLYYLGRYPESLEAHDRALALARSLKDEREIALELVRRGNVLAMIPGRAPEAIESVRTAGNALVQLGDRGEASYAHLFLGVILAENAALNESIQELEEAVRLGEAGHDLRRVGWSLFNLADIQREVGQLDTAMEQNRKSREILQRIGDRFGLVQTMIIQGKILLDLHRLPEAEVELLEAYRLVRELKTPADEVDVVLRLAQLAWSRGDRATAQRRVQELERQGLEALRPDIAPDFARLKASLAEKGTSAGGAS